jgi:hypothetical protein
VTANRDNLLRGGFTLTEQLREGKGVSRDLTIRRTVGEGSTASVSSLGSLLIDATDYQDLAQQAGMDPDSESDHSGSEAEPDQVGLTETPWSKVRFREKTRFRIKYDDPWKIHAGHVLGECLGKVPDTVLWSGDGIRLQDPLPKRLLGETWTGSEAKVRWTQIRDDVVKLHVIYTHTHWGKALHAMCNEPDSLKVGWARTLRYRINRFLKGASDPCLSARQRDALLVAPHEVRDRKMRSERFLELLKTVDGIFIQRYLAYPEEAWTWDRFDLFTLGNISNLIGDEFLDGELTQEALTLESAYSQLKRTRKWFKSHSHRGSLKQALGEMNEIPHWCRQFASVYKRAEQSTGARRVYLFGLLSQTRGAGTPPPLVVLQSKVKFLTTVAAEAPADNPTLRAIRLAAYEEVLAELPDSAFTGLATKSRITVSTASCWENTRREGGTTEEIRSLVNSGEAGEVVPVRNLDTGELECVKTLAEFESVGEYIFWSCLDQVLRIPREERRVAFLTVVKEPGKARSVTKARACLKVVLDLVAKICAEPLKKGIRSSHSGMAAANHGWNFFNSLSEEERRDLAFSLENREETAYEGYVERTDTFADLFVSSTDYEEATDKMCHTVARDLGIRWMRKCGIPTVLRRLVADACFQPRTVYFFATGELAHIGVDEGNSIRSILLRRGVLMGDPLTKVVLHLLNVVTRRVGARLHDADFYNAFESGSQMKEAFDAGLLLK